MLLALIWTGGETPSEGEREALAQAGRYIAAGGHALLLPASGGPAILAAESYRGAGGRHLAGLFPEGSPAPPPALFHETEPAASRAELPEAVARRADALLFLGPPDASHLAAARAAGKPAWAIGPQARGPVPGLRLLPDAGAFARELAKLFSRSIVSRRDPLAKRQKGGDRP